MGQFRTIYFLRAGFVSLFVIAFFCFCNVSITIVYVVGYSDVCVFRMTLPILYTGYAFRYLHMHLFQLQSNL